MNKLLLSVSLACFAGCSSPNPEHKFVGTWAFASGSDDVTCPNGTNSVKLKGNVIAKPASSGGLVVLDDQGCNFTYAVAGDQADLQGNRECKFAVPELGQGVTADVTYDSITLAVADGGTLRDTFTGKVSYLSSAGSLACIFSGSGTLTRVSDQ